MRNAQLYLEKLWLYLARLMVGLAMPSQNGNSLLPPYMHCWSWGLPGPGQGELCYNPGLLWLNGPGEQISGVQLVWAQIPTLPGGIRVEIEVPSLIPDRHPDPCPAGSPGAEHIPGKPEKAPAFRLSTAIFPPFKAVKFHSLRNMFFTHSNQETQDLSLSVAQTVLGHRLTGCQRLPLPLLAHFPLVAISGSARSPFHKFTSCQDSATAILSFLKWLWSSSLASPA